MSNGETIVFLHGADMAPETVRATWQGARFIARARVDAQHLQGVPVVPDLPQVWGILVSVSDLEASGAAPAVTATADDGRSFTATPVTQADALANPAETVAAARYWELPPAYVATLAAGVPSQ